MSKKNNKLIHEKQNMFCSANKSLVDRDDLFKLLVNSMMYMCDDQIQDFKYNVLTHLPRGARELYYC